MCVLICRVGERPLIGANRDESYDRPFSPPRIWTGSAKFWAPRDDEEGGTWIGVNEHGLVAAITNLSRLPQEKGRASRGHLVAGALEQSTVKDARAWLDAELATGPRNPCQVFVMQGPDAVVCGITPERCEFEVLPPGIHVLSNLHDRDEIDFGLPLDVRLDDLKPILSDTRKNLPRDFAVCKYAGWRGTVASTLIEPGVRFEFAPGPPDKTAYGLVEEYPG
jgi:hypothetical protein